MTKECGTTLEVRFARKLKVTPWPTKKGTVSTAHTSSLETTATLSSGTILTDFSIGLTLPTAFLATETPTVRTIDVGDTSPPHGRAGAEVGTTCRQQRPAIGQSCAFRLSRGINAGLRGRRIKGLKRPAGGCFRTAFTRRPLGLLASGQFLGAPQAQGADLPSLTVRFGEC